MLSDEILKKAQQITLLVLDVDGVLTDGKIYFADNGVETKAFNSKDGLGLAMFVKIGFEVAIITGRHSPMVVRRMDELGVQHVCQGSKDKKISYYELQQQLKFDDSEVAYVGDDLPDLALMRRVGLGITVADAPWYLREDADFVTQAKGGHGAVREVIDFILKAQGKLDHAIESYL